MATNWGAKGAGQNSLDARADMQTDCSVQEADNPKSADVGEDMATNWGAKGAGQNSLDARADMQTDCSVQEADNPKSADVGEDMATNWGAKGAGQNSLDARADMQTDCSVQDSTFLNSNITMESAASDMTYFPDKSSSFMDSTSVSYEPTEPLYDVRKITVPIAKNQKKCKRHFCIFCKTLQTKFARHIELKHKVEPQVREISSLPKGSQQRIKLLDALRKKGDFIYNTDANYNEGTFIVPRQLRENSKRGALDFVCCTGCKAYFPKITIRNHIKNCSSNIHKKGNRDILKSGRGTTGYMHSAANIILRNKIMPVLNDDVISRTIMYDHLIILFGNSEAMKHTEVQHDMIRANMRYLSRLLIAIKSECPDVIELKDVICPKYYDAVISGIRSVAEFNYDNLSFMKPTAATTLTCLVKKCARILGAQSIKDGDDSRKKLVNDFLSLWETEINLNINKRAVEDQTKKHRAVKVLIPTVEDIKLLYDFVHDLSAKALNELNSKFNVLSLTSLKQSTLISLLIFNRRRVGELERLTLESYRTAHSIGDIDDRANSNLYKDMSAKMRNISQNFTRVIIRGKKNRTVPVLFTPWDRYCIDNILEYGKRTINKPTTYIFSVPNPRPLRKEYIRACPILEKFANECGARCPESLRGTNLRKQLATHTSLSNVKDIQIDYLASFMGHHKDIHKNYYRVPASVAEMTQVSQLLMSAMNMEEENAEIVEANPDTEINNSESSNESNDEEPPEFVCTSDDANYSPPKRMVKRRSTSPFGKTRRVRWGPGERKQLENIFGNLETLEKLPSLKKCSQIINENPCFRGRTSAQLKTFLDNQRKAEGRKKSL
ncbi:uncharacterized protein LOC115768712 isoform X2 [Drosophila novamexicana]|uniref:uncharacterized protein LOC115761662 isoform X2 n=2 Tax=Drosophila novamexicana TaxID=47314 RepID=UPI0011E5AF3A|nr:uncharacterized protein LOC115761662 isoform X2 [Drosophila novamexicana]XP_030562445.1 uncharacterized protein LOC115763831 isoform X2 [Drosophila novamexicana]XP_030565899.1 uncharacterized protein LOC115766194 isoform X2 [Drosophila novamexicana]XP_030569268.1 uncharacterized protein LOC115768712 isoform X2 [Drosophila novamexicana]